MSKGCLIVGQKVYDSMDSVERQCLHDFINQGTLLSEGVKVYTTGLHCIAFELDHPDFSIGDDCPYRDELEYYLTLYKDINTGQCTLSALHCWYNGHHVTVREYSATNSLC